MQRSLKLDELVFQFLLSAGFPRAAVVSDVADVLPPLDSSAPRPVPSFIIVDPDTAALLALVDVCDSATEQAFEDSVAGVRSLATTLSGGAVQAFVIQVDRKAERRADQVCFFRVWPNTDQQQLSARTFPDLDSLRVMARLCAPHDALAAVGQVELNSPTIVTDPDSRPGTGLYLPAVFLVLLAVADWAASYLGTPSFTTAQAILATGAAALCTAAAISRG